MTVDFMQKIFGFLLILFLISSNGFAAVRGTDDYEQLKEFKKALRLKRELNQNVSPRIDTADVQSQPQKLYPPAKNFFWWIIFGLIGAYFFTKIIYEISRRNQIYYKYGKTDIAKRIIDKKVWMGQTVECVEKKTISPATLYCLNLSLTCFSTQI